MNETEQKKYHGKSLIQWFIPTRKFLIWSSLLLILTIICSFTLLQYWAHNHFKAIVEDDMQYEELKEFLNQDLDFPKDLLRIASPSNQLERVYSNIASIEATLPVLERASNDIWMAQKNPAVLEKHLEELTPYIQAASELAQQFEKEIHNAPAGSPLSIHHFGNAYVCETLVNLLEPRAALRVSSLQYDGALEDYVNAILLSIRCPLHNFKAYMQNLPRIKQLASKCTGLAVPYITSTVGLKRALQSLNRIEPHLFPKVSDRAKMLSYLSIFRDYGLEYTEREKKWEYYLDRIIKKQSPYTKSDLQVNLINRTALSDIKIAVLLQSVALSNYVNDYIRLYYYKKRHFHQGLPLYTEIQSQQDETGAAFDRLRLTIAARLYELETGKKVVATTDLVPDYFPEEIKDRQSGESYRWNENGYLWGF